MSLLLKDEIIERIIQAGVEVFYEKSYRNAEMQEIAERVGLPVSMICNYYYNKEKLFDRIVSSLQIYFDKITDDEEWPTGFTAGKCSDVVEKCVMMLRENHKVFVILMDKSQGTKHEHSKNQMIRFIEHHTRRQFAGKAHTEYNNIMCHILARNFVEGIIDVARHYEDRRVSRKMLSFEIKCYYEGVNSL